MTLCIRTQVTSSIVNTCSGISIAQQHTFTDIESCSLCLNFSMGTYVLPQCSTWVPVAKGDIGSIRETYLTLTSTVQSQGIGLIITADDPNACCCSHMLNMRETFVATTCIPASDTLYIKNYGCCEATLTAILGGENV